MSTAALPRPGTPSQIRQVTAALQSAIADRQKPVALTFTEIVRHGGPVPHIAAGAINAGGDQIARELGSPVRVVGEKNHRKVVVG